MRPYREVLDAIKGRCAVASTSLRAGDRVLITSAVCAASSPSSCGWCFAPGDVFSRCSACRKARYCSRACQQRDWPQHRHECAAWRSIPERNPSPTVLLVARLAAKLFLGSQVDQEEKNGVLKLRDHLADHTELKRHQFDEMTQLVLLLLSRYKAEKREKNATLDELHRDLELEILKLFGRVNCNAFSVANEFTNEAVGIGLYPEGALFNHDCDPNCVVSFKGREMQVRVVRDIEVDEELTVSYVELLQSTKARRRELKESYFFDCECKRCKAATNGQSNEDWYLDGLRCSNKKCASSGGVEITAFERELESLATLKAESNASRWEKYRREWEILTNRLQLHPRNSRVATMAREIGNFLLVAISPELRSQALRFLLAELQAVEWLLPKTKLPSRGLLHFQMGKVVFEEVNAPLNAMPQVKKVDTIQQAAKHLQEALTV
ncbi:hypothetical protein PHYSODRAFT_518318 [Phytophthora sojae]|uniref:MYND-type domain-containing protein n=1 Tax=Phytophthora sojae (strain P6497) TaxID=1094619 RepID=G5A023_PHYSP|nr:hypothetical protein PHYSODRAFT_518318 [Phytophthora sojae]EGZ10465.1 hypothetical protein PHYSODRAFT_518318 [Phytophthora sojae]|eukprot:XP_009533210.1 hypothetical protein PHYSODRAFT_518318 [Phytophthora sojae]